MWPFDQLVKMTRPQAVDDKSCTVCHVELENIRDMRSSAAKKIK